MRQIFIFLIIFASYFFAHYLVFQTAVTFLGVRTFSGQMVLFGIAAFLSLGFIGSLFLVHSTDNLVARWLYFVFGLWAGILVNLLLASFAAWLIFGIANLFDFQIDLAVGFLSVCFIAVLFSFWGVWNAYHPIVNEVEIAIKDLPENWEGKKVVQLSDIHLGNVLQKNFMEKIARQVDSIDPEMIFLTGDVFDGVGSDLEEFILPLNHIKADKGIFFVTGNHETYLGVEKVYKALSQTRIKILDDELAEYEGLQIFGISYPERNEKKDVGQIIAKNKEVFSRKPTILLNHVPTNLEEAENAGVDLQLSGHTHRGQLLPFGFITNLIFGKSHYGLSKQGDFLLYTSSGLGVWGPTMRTSAKSEIVVITLKKKVN